MGDRGHNRHGPKLGRGDCAFFSGDSWVHIEHNVAQAEAYLHTKWHPDPCSRLATIDMGRKIGEGAVLLWVGGARSPSNTMSLGPRPTSVPSGILIHAAVSPQ